MTAGTVLFHSVLLKKTDDYCLMRHALWQAALTLET
jgi:hypothetical protein